MLLLKGIVAAIFKELSVRSAGGRCAVIVCAGENVCVL
jgi:hypothetical protein